MESISWENLTPNLTTLYIYINNCTEEGLYQTKFDDFKMSYIYNMSLNLFFIFTNSLNDDDGVIDQLLKYVRQEFLNYYSPEIILNAEDMEVFASFDSITTLTHTYFKPIIALIGFNNVGKTTIANLLTKDVNAVQTLPESHKSIHPIQVKNLDFELWDFNGEEKLLFQWPKYLKNSDLALLIIDSTPQNVEKSNKFFIDLLKKDFPNMKLGIIANKQDVQNALSPSEIAKMINHEQIYKLNSIEQNSAENLSLIIRDWLSISDQVSPRLDMILERKKLMMLTDILTNEGNNQKALESCELVVEYSRKLDEHEIVLDYLDKIHKLKLNLESSRQDNLMKEVVEKIKTDPMAEPIITVVKDKIPDRDNVSTLSEIDSLQKNIDVWKDQANAIEEEIKLLDLKQYGNLIQEDEYNQKKDKLTQEKLSIQEKLHDAKLQMINLI